MRLFPRIAKLEAKLKPRDPVHVVITHYLADECNELCAHFGVPFPATSSDELKQLMTDAGMSFAYQATREVVL